MVCECFYTLAKMIKVICPYCKSLDTEDLEPETHSCNVCGKTFNSGYSDGNRHSLSEVSDKFPSSSVLGELQTVSYKKESNFCHVCGTVYDQHHKMCPTFKDMLLDYWENKHHPLLDDEGFSVSEVTMAIDGFLKRKTGSSANGLLKKRRKTKANKQK